MVIRKIQLVLLMGLLVLLAGCAGRGRPPSTQPTSAPAIATAIPPETALPSYWLAQEPVASVRSSSYSDLMQECEHVLRQRFFHIDRIDFRSGMMTSKPMVSKQFWEFWRNDVGSTQQTFASSVCTYSRTVQWNVRQAEQGGFVAVPHVVVERFTSRPRHVSTVVDYRAALSPAESQTGLPLSNLDKVPADSWYAVGRDKDLETALAQDLLDRMLKHSSSATLQRNASTGSR